MYTAIVSTTEDGRVAKHKDFATEAEAQDHVVAYGGFVAEHPGGDAAEWLVDGETVTVSPPPDTTPWWRKRKEAYREKIAAYKGLPDASHEDVIGFVIDAQRKAAKGDTAEFDEMDAIIEQVKTDIPKE